MRSLKTSYWDGFLFFLFFFYFFYKLNLKYNSQYLMHLRTKKKMKKKKKMMMMMIYAEFLNKDTDQQNILYNSA